MHLLTISHALMYTALFLGLTAVALSVALYAILRYQKETRDLTGKHEDVFDKEFFSVLFEFIRFSSRKYYYASRLAKRTFRAYRVVTVLFPVAVIGSLFVLLIAKFVESWPWA
jgi:hypothetical protein